MLTLTVESVLKWSHSACVRTLLSCALVLCGPVAARAQSGPSTFTGLYVGVEVGRLNVIGGALVVGQDTLAQDTRAAVDLIVGGRYAFANRVVLGLEWAAGVEDGDLVLDDPSSGLRVDYRNGSHWRLGGTAGVVLGAARATHVFGYVNELSRDFDVTITQGAEVTTQRDEQGLLRYGGGVEQRLAPRLTLRGTLGSSRADFGGRPTNITPTRPLEAAIGLLFRF